MSLNLKMMIYVINSYRIITEHNALQKNTLTTRKRC